MKRRVEKDHVERLAFLLEVSQRIAPDQPDLRCRQFADIGPQCRRHTRMGLDHDHLTGTARGRFKAERAGAGEQIQAAGTRQFGLQPAEQCFPQPIAGWSQSRRSRKGQPATAVAAGNDADFAGTGNDFGFAHAV